MKGWKVLVNLTEFFYTNQSFAYPSQKKLNSDLKNNRKAK